MAATDTQSLQDSYAVESGPSSGRHILPCPCSPTSHRRIDGGSTTTPTVALYHNRLTWWSPGRFGKVSTPLSAYSALSPAESNSTLECRTQSLCPSTAAVQSRRRSYRTPGMLHWPVAGGTEAAFALPSRDVPSKPRVNASSTLQRLPDPTHSGLAVRCHGGSTSSLSFGRVPHAISSLCDRLRRNNRTRWNR